MIKTPPFERGRNHRNDRPELVERLWGMINSKFWYDSRLRSVGGRAQLVERLWGMINSKFWYDSRLRSVGGKPSHSWLN